MKISEHFKKIQALPESQRKIIFWTIFILVIFLAFVFWLTRAKARLESFRQREIFEGINPGFPQTEDFPKAKEDFQENLEELKKLKELIEEIEE